MPPREHLHYLNLPIYSPTIIVAMIQYTPRQVAGTKNSKSMFSIAKWSGYLLLIWFGVAKRFIRLRGTIKQAPYNDK